jgi:hypothetical protein
MINAVMRATLTRIGFSEGAAETIVEDQRIDSLDKFWRYNPCRRGRGCCCAKLWCSIGHPAGRRALSFPDTLFL